MVQIIWGLLNWGAMVSTFAEIDGIGIAKILVLVLVLVLVLGLAYILWQSRNASHHVQHLKPLFFIHIQLQKMNHNLAKSYLLFILWSLNQL